LVSTLAVSAGPDQDKLARYIDPPSLPARRQRMQEVENRIALLFTPPFDRGAAEPGYIKAHALIGPFDRTFFYDSWRTFERASGP
jgi:hypothetical protein